MHSQRKFNKLLLVLGVALLLGVGAVGLRHLSDKSLVRLNKTRQWQVAGQQGHPQSATESGESRAEMQASAQRAPLADEKQAQEQRADLSKQLPSHIARIKVAETASERSESASSLPPAARSGELDRAGREHKEPGPTNPDDALRFRRLQMQDEKGEIPPDAMEKARRHVALMKIAQQERIRARQQSAQKSPPESLSAGIKPDSWTWLGPGNVGGRIRAIAIDPGNANNMWVGSVSGGIWATQNAGRTWFPVNDFLANLAVSTMVINPTNPSIMYAGTGEGFGNIDALQGAGIFQSNDNGVTWNQSASTANANFFFVNRLAISPNGNTILAATSQVRDVNNNIIATGGIWSSTNGGANWTQETIAQAFDVDFQPLSNTQAVAGGEGGAMFRTLSPAGIPTWTAATFNPGIAAQPVQPPPPAPPIMRLRRRVEVAYAPGTPTTLYAVVNQYQGSGNYQGEIYRSTDGGQNFTRVHMGTNFFVGANNQGWYDNVIWVNPQDSRFLIVGGINLWRSIDSGATFTQISDGSLDSNGIPRSPHADHHVIVAHPGFNNTTNQTVFFGNDGGIYATGVVATANTFQGWGELNNQLGITQFYSAAGNAATGLIVGGAQDNGTLRFVGDTERWTSMNGGDGGYCAADPTDPTLFYGESQNLGVVRSTDGGESASPINAGIADAGVAGATNFIAPLVLDPNDPSTLLAGGISLWRSTDVNVKTTTPTWTAIKAPIAGNPISAIAVSPITSSLIVVGHNSGAIFYTLGGTLSSPTWTQINTAALPSRFVTRLVIDSTRSTNWIYVTFGGFSGDNVYRTTDFGATWTDITGTGATGLPSVPVRSLVFHPVNPNLLYVGTEVGVFTSDDAGATWELPQDGPANVSVDELFWLAGDLIAATHGRGLYRASGGIYVDRSYTGVEQHGTLDQPFKTIAAGVNAATTYRAIWIRPGNYNEPMRINKRLELRSLGGTVIIGRN